MSIPNTIPWDSCDNDNLNYDKPGLFAKTPGHWFCFTDDDVEAYQQGYNKCMSQADARGVPQGKEAYWCGGWPDLTQWYEIPGSGPISSINYLLPVVLLMVGGGLLYWYLYA